MKTRMTLRPVLAAVALSLAMAFPARAAELTVSAAASLTNAFQELKAAYEKANPGTAVHTNFAASGALFKQMAEGAPVDVFASADQATMDKAVALKLVDPATRGDFAANSLVMIVPAGSSLDIKDPKDLTGPGVEHIAIGNPGSVPAGAYARQSLTSTGLYDALAAKFVLATSVRQVLDYVSRGEVAAGFVYKTDALMAGGKVRIVAAMAGHDPVTYPVAVLAASPGQEEGRQFIRFLTSPEGQAVLARYGFSKP